MSSDHIFLRGVHKSFGALHAVRNVSLNIKRNEFVTLLGPSGCGKTTLLRLIGGLDVADEGEIVVDGLAVQDTPPRQRQTRMVFQQYALFPHMSVARNVEFGLRMRSLRPDVREERVKAALAMVQLSDKAVSKPHELSGGQQQRVALARAIVTEPSVLLLDEPLAALDLQLRKSMQIELKSLQRRLGMTFIYVTHDQSEALAMSDRIVVMSGGQIEQAGTAKQVYEQPATAFVARFIGETNFLTAQVLSQDGEVALLSLAGWNFRASMLGGPSVGSGAIANLMIRPEDVNVSLTPGEGLACSATEIIYMGSFSRLVLKTADGQSISAQVPADFEAKPGGAVFVSWRLSTARLIRD